MNNRKLHLICFSMLAVKHSLWTTMAIILLDAAIMIYVNLKNDSEAVLAIPCAIVGIIVFWFYLVRGGELGHTLGTQPSDTVDDCKPDGGGAFKEMGFFHLLYSKLTKANKGGDTCRKETDHNDVKKMKPPSPNEGNRSARGYVLKKVSTLPYMDAIINHNFC